MNDLSTADLTTGGCLSLDVQETVSADFLGVFDVGLRECLRDLPGRRSVWRAGVNGGDILLKVFNPHAKQERDVEAEWKNSLLLHEMDLPIPEPLFLAHAGDGWVVLGFAWIEQSVSLDELLCGAEGDERRQGLEQLVALHHSQHQQGCCQADNHLGNYLWSEGTIWMLDAGSYVFGSAGLDQSTRTSNMALLAANIPLRWLEEFRTAVDRRYKLGLGAMDGAVKAAIRTRQHMYYKKTRRSCSEFERIREGRWDALFCRDFDSGLRQKLLADPDDFFNGQSLIKDGNTCSVVEVSHGGRSYILKRYNPKSWWYRVSHMLMTPRALLSWSNGHVLRLFGIATPRPCACLLDRPGGLLRSAYLLMEKVDGESLLDAAPALIERSSTRLPAQFADLWHELDWLDAHHGDFKATNLMVDQGGELLLIDLDGLRFCRSVRGKKRGQEKDRKRFMRNWDDRHEVQQAFAKVFEVSS